MNFFPLLFNYLQKAKHLFLFMLLAISFNSCYMFENMKKKKCPIESCNVRFEHFHEETVFRSRVTPWWKKNQNPKIGQDWKSQKDDRKDKVRKRF